MHKLLVVTLIIGSASCGKDQSTKSKDSPAVTVDRANGMTFADDSTLPACDGSREGALVYVTNTKNFRSCGSGQWTTIDLTGVKGDKGDVGAAGPAGAVGPAAASDAT